MREASNLGFDERGNWYAEIGTPDDEAPNGGVDREIYRSNGVWMIAIDPQRERGRHTTSDESVFRPLTGPLRAMGRQFDADGGRRLHEVLAAASSLKSLAPTEDHPWPGVEAAASVMDHPVVVRVRCDPREGFVPRYVEWFDGAPLRPLERYEILSTVRVGELWLPCVVATSVYSRWERGRNAEQVSAIEAKGPQRARALTLAGLPEVDPATADRIRSAVARLQRVEVMPEEPDFVCAPLGAAAKDGPYMPDVCFVEYGSVNRPIDPARLYPSVGPEADLFCGLRNRWVKGSEVMRGRGVGERSER
ncbi:MAG: hypothetical protein KIT68_03815 [Phycisphaeraceae bacterium]|nr:hypothetical protein [Phycisphaeraceae bacterium]